MKPLGALLLTAAGFLLGWGRARELSERVALLTDLRQLVSGLSAEIGFTARPLPELLARSGSRFCRRAVGDGLFSADPRAALGRAGEALLKNAGDRAWFGDFVSGLGATDAAGQQEHLRLCGALLEDRLREAREDAAQKRRLYVVLGAFAGVTVSLVLI